MSVYWVAGVERTIAEQQLGGSSAAADSTPGTRQLTRAKAFTSCGKVCR
jgi:hypothetical protein